MEKDKLYHFLVNFIFMITFMIFFDWIHGACFCIGISIGKEYGDSKAKGNYWSWCDIVADLLGMSVPPIVMFVIGLIR